jgi:hypothetical protein
MSNFDNEKAPGAIKKQTKNLTREGVPVFSLANEKINCVCSGECAQVCVGSEFNHQSVKFTSNKQRRNRIKERRLAFSLNQSCNFVSASFARRVVNLAMVCARAHLACAVAQR